MNEALCCLIYNNYKSYSPCEAIERNMLACSGTKLWMKGESKMSYSEFSEKFHLFLNIYVYCSCFDEDRNATNI